MAKISQTFMYRSSVWPTCTCVKNHVSKHGYKPELYCRVR